MIFAGTFRANHWQNTWSGFGFQDLYTPHQREHVLPNGCFELIIDLRDEPHRKAKDGRADGSGREFLHSVNDGA